MVPCGRLVQTDHFGVQATHSFGLSVDSGNNTDDRYNVDGRVVKRKHNHNHNNCNEYNDK